MAARMLTAQQVQDLLDVDASTIYRMAADGRLPAVRIGRQWRFPAQAIERLLVPPSGNAGDGDGAAAVAWTPRDVPSGPGAGLPAGDVTDMPELPVDLATDVLELVAPLLGVTMVVTDLAGRPVTPLVNPAPRIAARLDDPTFIAACTAEWQGFAAEPHLVPRLQPSQHGFLCAHGLVRRGTTLVAMVLAGGIARGGEPDLFQLDEGQRARVLDALPRTAALLSRLVAAGRPATPTW